MEARAELRQVRISPRKVGVVLDLIRNKPCDMAMAILKHTPKSASDFTEAPQVSNGKRREQSLNGSFQVLCFKLPRWRRRYFKENQT